jgi:HemK-like putative methylase
MHTEISVIVSEPGDQKMTSMDIDLSFALPDGVNDDDSFFSVDLPKNKIEVVKRYKDWCILSVTRGNGPRVVEEWILSNESQCFDRPALAYSSDSETNSDREKEREEQDLQDEGACTNPVLANPHNAACAHSLILAARHPSLLKELTYLRVTVHCLVKGYHPPGTEIQFSNIIERRKCQTRATCLEVAPSNSAGHISLLVAHNSETDSTHIGARQFRRHLGAGGWPVLGAARDCYAFRGEKMCLSVVGLDFQAKGIQNRQAVTIPPVPKLRRVLEKEERFYKQRQGVDAVRTELFGSELPKPIEYIEEKATFDGLEFRVTPTVMIPRKGTETLVGIVDTFFSNRKDTGGRPLILDLGTGCGNLLLAILKRLCHLNAAGVGIDAMRGALDLCDYNIAALGMIEQCTSIQGKFADLRHLKHDPFDAVVCNPPYMTRGGRRNLDATTTFEPERALYVDREERNIHYEDVLDGLIQGNLLVPGALVVFEVCKENSDAIMSLMKDRGLVKLKMDRDWKDCIRAVQGIFAPNEKATSQ